MVNLQGGGAPNLIWNGQTTGNTFTTVATTSQVITLVGTNAAGCSTQQLHPLFVDICDGIEVNHPSLEAQLFPNPVYESLTVILGEAAVMSVYDTNCHLVRELEGRAGEQILSFSDFSAGVYQVVLQNDTKRSVYRMIKH